MNLSDTPLTLSVTLVDPQSTDEFEVGRLDVQPLQVTSQKVLPTRLRLGFDYPGGSANEGGTCVIDVADAEEIQFAVFERGGVIAVGPEPDDPAELDLATSSRCKAGGAS